MHLANPDTHPRAVARLWLATKRPKAGSSAPSRTSRRKNTPAFKAVVATLGGLPGEQIPGPQPVQRAPLISLKGHTPIKYVGKRDHYKDGTYGTGHVFAKGQTLMVPTDKAILMLRHPDVYVQGEVAPDAPVAEAPPAAKKANAPESEEDSIALEDAHRALATMNRARMAAYAKVNWNVEVDVTKDPEIVRGEVKRLIDRFGLPHTSAA
jgi:hypothetical protein